MLPLLRGHSALVRHLRRAVRRRLSDLCSERCCGGSTETKTETTTFPRRTRSREAGGRGGEVRRGREVSFYLLGTSIDVLLATSGFSASGFAGVFSSQLGAVGGVRLQTNQFM